MVRTILILSALALLFAAPVEAATKRKKERSAVRHDMTELLRGDRIASLGRAIRGTPGFTPAIAASTVRSARVAKEVVAQAIRQKAPATWGKGRPTSRDGGHDAAHDGGGEHGRTTTTRKVAARRGK